MGIIRRGTRRFAQAVARRVARNHLFEQPGERPPTPPLPPAGDAGEASGDPSAAGDADLAPSPSPGSPGAAARREPGCRPADIAALRAALGPGGGVRVVNHWATWCDPCVEELPALRALAADLPADVSMIGVSWDLFDPRGDAETVARQVAEFSAEHGMSWPSLLVTADEERFFADLDVRWPRIPQTWLLDDEGTVQVRVEGVLDEAGAARLRRAIEEACR